MGEPEQDIEAPVPGRRGGGPDQRSGIMIAPDVVETRQGLPSESPIGSLRR